MDTVATNHMLPNKAAFISYYPVSGQQVQMSNNFFAPILGHNTAIISLNGKKIQSVNVFTSWSYETHFTVFGHTNNNVAVDSLECMV